LHEVRLHDAANAQLSYIPGPVRTPFFDLTNQLYSAWMSQNFEIVGLLITLQLTILLSGLLNAGFAH